MTVKEVEERMKTFAQEIIDDCDAKLAVLPQNAKLEIKAQKIRKNMAGICWAFAHMGYSMKNPMPLRRKFVSELSKIPDDCSDAEITYLHAILRIEDIFVGKYLKELETAKNFNADEDIFRLETQLDVIKNITKKWHEFGKTEGFENEY